ncbi:MAG: putative rane-anchored protein [Actinomycetia bacterium]|nr:putative rane-anchored protein [Actinomycetes bacterium]
MAAGHQGQGSGFAGAVKVPAVKQYFWVVKLLTTAMGEAVSDYLVNDVNKYLAVVVGFVLFVIAITWQFRTPTYRTWPYWSAVAMVAVFGTMCADVMHIVLGLPYTVSATFYAVCLIVTFVTWYRSERTLDIHSIVTRRREVFYWLAVIFTFAMGTALGDLLANTFHLGYLGSAFVFTALIWVPFIAWRLGVNPVLTFWVAYILTRPIGASFADYFGMPKAISGMGLGHGVTSVVTLILVVASLIYLSRSGIDQPEPGSVAGPHAGPRYGQPQYAQPRPAQPQYGQPNYGQPQYGQPRPEYGQPQYADPRYGQPQYGDPRQGQPQYGQQPPYGEAQYGQPQYGDPRYADPRYADPRYADPRQQGDPRYPADPRYGNQRYGDQQDYRSP